MEGAAGLALGLHSAEGPTPSGGDFAPAALEGLAAAALDVNRLAAVVAAFREVSAPVAIVWSESARILDDGVAHLASARRAFEGCSFAGHKLRFLTERQLEAGQWQGVRVVVIPETPALGKEAFAGLQRLINGGAAVVRSTKPIPYDARGRAQNDVLDYGAGALLVRGNDASTEYLDAMDEVMSRGGLPSVPRVVNGSGYPIEGVKTRFVDVDGALYLYLVNLRKESVRCELVGTVQSGRDLIRGRPVTFPTMVEPLTPALIRLERGEA